MSLEQIESFCFISKKYHDCDNNQRHDFLALVVKKVTKTWGLNLGVVRDSRSPLGTIPMAMWWHYSSLP